MSIVDDAWANLEPHCAEIARGARDIPAANQLLLLSAATSLKRIADALDGTTLGVDISESLAGITNELIRHRS